MASVLSSSAVGEKINEWYMYIRRFSIPDAEYLRREIKEELAGLEDDQDLHLYYSLMEFRHNLMLEYLEPLESQRIEEQPRLSDLLADIDKKQARLTGRLDYYFNFFRGMYELECREYLSAIQFFKKAESKLTYAKDHIEKAEFYFKMSEVYYYMKQTYVSMDYARQAYFIYKDEKKYNIRLTQCHSLFGANYLDVKQYDHAISHFQKAYTMAELEQQPQLMGRTLFNIALCHNNQNNKVEAIPHLKEAIAVFEKAQMSHSLPQPYFLLTQIYFKLENIDNAYDYHKKGISICKEIDDIIYEEKFKFLEYLYMPDPRDTLINDCLHFLENKLMYADIEELALDVAKYYYTQEEYKKASVYFLKVEEARQQIEGGVNLYEIEV
ncbi:Rap family tetratricopeptide repeat protein [Bacillus velezensis]|uniref:Rap family tetratricopeptide repeat protein n=1 Tax=Bacillus velezensis TaxID=492670 RepID=UPI000E2877BA|nr:Rap family tetratricopeptide repeat protein [Bacillus velezensis]RDY84769.1 aspartate phosphatase [Bacillus velezensis]